MPQVDLNYWAIIVSAVVSMAIGMLWYSPVLFGKQWMKLSGISKADIDKAKEKGMATTYLAAFIAVLVMAYVLAYIVDFADANTFSEGMQGGFWVWLGFVAPVLLSMVLWEGKPKALYALYVFYYLVTLTLMGGILAAWA